MHRCLILWDIFTAAEIHNRIRALTDPYPGAFTFFEGRRVKLVRSALNHSAYFGEPGRVYQIAGKNLLVCASDECLWIQEAVFDDGQPLHKSIQRYEHLATVRRLVTKQESG